LCARRVSKIAHTRYSQSKTIALNEKQKQYHTVGTVPKSNIKIVERGKTDTPNTNIYDRSLSLLGTGTSIKSHIKFFVVK